MRRHGFRHSRQSAAKAEGVVAGAAVGKGTAARFANAPGQVRIIGGAWRSRRVPVPAKEGLRPTPDRVRETLFNWLGQDLAGWLCLDAFAGSGALGLEAASRGAQFVQMVEMDGSVAKHLHRIATQLGAANVTVSHGDGMRALMQKPAGQEGAQGWDVIFIDPPYAQGLDEKALTLAATSLAQGGWVYLESATGWDPAALAALGWRLHRHLRAGAVHAHLLQRQQANSPSTGQK